MDFKLRGISFIIIVIISISDPEEKTDSKEIVASWSRYIGPWPELKETGTIGAVSSRPSPRRRGGGKKPWWGEIQVQRRRKLTSIAQSHVKRKLSSACLQRLSLAIKTHRYCSCTCRCRNGTIPFPSLYYTIRKERKMMMELGDSRCNGAGLRHGGARQLADVANYGRFGFYFPWRTGSSPACRLFHYLQCWTSPGILVSAGANLCLFISFFFFFLLHLFAMRNRSLSIALLDKNRTWYNGPQ